MAKTTRRRAGPEDMKPEYDFSKGVRGITAARYREGTNLVLLDPDVAAVFPDADAVNEALRSLARIAKRATGGTTPKRGRRTAG